MRVKIGDEIFDSRDQPIMVILSEADKKNISSMVEKSVTEESFYASFPNHMTADEARGFMRID